MAILRKAKKDDDSSLQDIKPGAWVKVDESLPQTPTPLQSKYDVLKIPEGVFNFSKAGILFRNVDAPTNRENIKQYDTLIAAGYEIKLWNVFQGNIYLLFEKK